MVRRGSTVRVRQRALQKRRTSALFCSARLAPERTCGGYGAVYGAFRFEVLSVHVPPKAKSRPPERVFSRSSYGRPAMNRENSLSDGSHVSKLLAPLAVGDRLPWKLDREGRPQWLVVVDVLSATSYLVRYPDGKTEILVDSE
jgi:hypothetical protein